jgi:hypothetical protein
VRWPWERKPTPPEIPPFKLDFKPIEPRDPNYVVEEKEMSETGMFRLFPWKRKEQK